MTKNDLIRMNANLTNKKEREIWADYVKAIAIYLMVLCHFNLNSEIGKQFIWIFHMPVFFLISGYFDKGLPFSMDILKKDFRTLIIPYFFFSVCNLTICWVPLTYIQNLITMVLFCNLLEKPFWGCFLWMMLLGLMRLCHVWLLGFWLRCLK